MASVIETLMQNVLARLKAAPRFGGVKVESIRRSHRTHVTRANAPAIHLIDGEETPERTKVGKGCAVPWDKSFTISLFIRDDEGFGPADELKLEVMARLGPDGGQWPSGVVLRYGRITYEQEVADGDALRVDMDFEFTAQLAAWTLDQGAS